MFKSKEKSDTVRKVTYRLYPSAKQEAALKDHLRAHQQLYNAALEERIDAYRKEGKSIGYVDQCALLTQLRAELPEWAAYNAASQQMTLRKLQKAFNAFFKRVREGKTPGFPRFKSFDRYPGFSYRSHGDGWMFTPKDAKTFKNGTLRLSGIGHIPARGKARQPGDIKSSDILHRSGKWYLSLTLDVKALKRERTGNDAMAFDWGVSSFLSCAESRGNTYAIDNPRWSKKAKEKTILLQQAIARKTNRRSNRRKKAVKELAAHKGRVARQRLAWMHQLTSDLAKKYALVATEKLAIKNMTKSAKGTVEEPGKSVAQKAGLNREILDTAPSLFTSLLKYKVQETGAEWIEAPTVKLKPSQRCPRCWTVAKKTLSERVHSCSECGHTEPRDTASAQVVLRWAIEPGLSGAGTGPRRTESNGSLRETSAFAQA